MPAPRYPRWAIARVKGTGDAACENLQATLNRLDAYGRKITQVLIHEGSVLVVHRSRRKRRPKASPGVASREVEPFDSELTT